MDRKKKDKQGASQPVNPNSRAAIRAKAEAEEREKQEWIAARKRQEKEEAAARREKERQEAEDARRREKEEKAAERKRKARERAEKNKGLVKGIKITAIVVLALVVVLGGLGIYAGYRITNSQQNLPNIYLNGIPVGGMTREETVKKLAEQGWDDPEALTLKVKLPMGVSFELDRCQAGLLLTREEAAAAAFRFGHSSDIFENMFDYLRARTGQVDLTGSGGQLDRNYVRSQVEAAVQEFRDKTSGEGYFLDEEEGVLHFVKGAGAMELDVDQICASAEEALKGEETELVYEQSFELDMTMPDFDALHEELTLEPVDAHFAEEGFEVVEGAVGRTFDAATARELWLKAKPMEEILIPLEILEPAVTKEALESMLFRDCLGRQTTSFLWSSNNRINNINLAVSKINGTILMPGETFSYNGTVGERTWEAGFREAGAYMNGEVIEAIGGGICQVSSTLYCATLYARMTIVERECHWFSVSYLLPGRDATVDWDGEVDFKFKNDREYPVKIVAYCNNTKGEVTVEIWGTDIDGITVTLSDDQYYLCDEKYTDVRIGTHVVLYIHYYDADGNYLYTERGADSDYHKHDDEIDWPPEYYEDQNGDGDENGDPIIDDGGGSGGGDPGGGDGGGGDGGDDSGGGGDDDGGDVIVVEDP